MANSSSVRPRDREAAHVTIYGDFSCPFSALASARAASLEDAGVATVDWRSVVHDPEVPAAGMPNGGAAGRTLTRKIAQARDRLAAGEDDPLDRPSRVLSSTTVNAAYAATPQADRRRLRTQVFTFYWRFDLTNPDSLAIFGLHGEDTATASGWQEVWATLPDPEVPLMILPDGHVSRGVGVLDRLRRALDGDLASLRRR